MKSVITNFLRFGTLISTYGLIISVLVQILARFLLPNAPAWTEEASRLFFIYSVAFSAGSALESKDYVSLDWFFQKLPEKVRQFITVVIWISTIILFGMMTFYSIEFMVLGHLEYSPGMKIKMSFVFFSMCILSGALCYFIAVELLQTLKKTPS